MHGTPGRNERGAGAAARAAGCRPLLPLGALGAAVLLAVLSKGGPCDAGRRTGTCAVISQGSGRSTLVWHPAAVSSMLLTHLSQPRQPLRLVRLRTIFITHLDCIASICRPVSCQGLLMLASRVLFAASDGCSSFSEKPTLTHLISHSAAPLSEGVTSCQPGTFMEMTAADECEPATDSSAAHPWISLVPFTSHQSLNFMHLAWA